jgi:hypothetical protein
MLLEALPARRTLGAIELKREMAPKSSEGGREEHVPFESAVR